MVKTVTQTGRTGWYARVLREGNLEAGMLAERMLHPNPSWPVQRANDVMYGREVDRMAVVELMNLPQLADAWKQDIS